MRDALAREYSHLDLTLIPNTYQPELDGELTPKTGKKFAFVGTIDERKGVHIIAASMKEVVKQHPDVELHIIGNQPEGTGSPYAIEQFASLRQTLGDRLVLHGSLPSTALFNVLDECVALLAPSIEEMFGNQLIEGLMRGCHGIVAEGTALDENVRRFGNGTVVPQQDARALADAILATLSTSLSAMNSEVVRQTIRRHMSPATVAELHNELYLRILAATK